MKKTIWKELNIAAEGIKSLFRDWSVWHFVSSDGENGYVYSMNIVWEKYEIEGTDKNDKTRVKTGRVRVESK